MNNFYITPNDENIMASNDSASIQAAVDYAAQSGCNKVIIPSYNSRTGKYIWNISKEIALPSNMHLVLDNCHLRLEDNVFCNIFCSSNCYTDENQTAENELKNICIEGIGNALLDGGEYNGLSEQNSLKDGMPHISRNTTILFRNVNGFKISGLRFRDYRWWGMTFVFCRNGRIHDIDFDADLSMVGPNGEKITDKLPTTYREIYVRNTDGIDLRSGCNNIIIENITGFNADDTVALTVLNGSTEKMFFVEGKDTDVHDVIIRNIMSDAFLYSNVRLLNADGKKLYNILVDGIVDTSPKNGKYKSMGNIRIGDVIYGDRDCQSGENYNITVKNVISRGDYGVLMKSTVENVYISNIQMEEDCIAAVGSKDRATLKDITIEKLRFAPNIKKTGEVSFEDSVIENVKIK